MMPPPGRASDYRALFGLNDDRAFHAHRLVDRAEIIVRAGLVEREQPRRAIIPGSDRS